MRSTFVGTYVTQRGVCIVELAFLQGLLCNTLHLFGVRMIKCSVCRQFRWSGMWFGGCKRTHHNVLCTHTHTHTHTLSLSLSLSRRTASTSLASMSPLLLCSIYNKHNCNSGMCMLCTPRDQRTNATLSMSCFKCYMRACKSCPKICPLHPYLLQ